MINWWNSLSFIEQTFACVAIPSTILLVLQTVLLLFSSFGGEGDDFDADHDTDFDHNTAEHGHSLHDTGLRIFTVRGFITFFCMFGWTGLVMVRSGVNHTASVVTAVVVGAVFMVLVAYILVQFLKLQSNGTMDIRTAVGVCGSVYLTIPAKRGGTGKVSAVVSGRFSEFDAVTDEENDIKTNSSVTVVGITGNNTLVVAKK